jgi:DNA-binding transcriptional regulator LsrR (DeoR family)
VAEIIGRPIDKQGQAGPADIQQRVTSLPLQCPATAGDCLCRR